MAWQVTIGNDVCVSQEFLGSCNKKKAQNLQNRKLLFSGPHLIHTCQKKKIMFVQGLPFNCCIKIDLCFYLFFFLSR